MNEKPQRISAQLFCAIGTALYGDNTWHRAIAREIGVSDGSVRQWCRPDKGPPISIMPELRAMLIAKRSQTDNALKALEIERLKHQLNEPLPAKRPAG